MSTDTQSGPAPLAAETPPLGTEALKSSLLGSLFYHLLPIRRRTVMRNLRQVFGQRMDELVLRRLARSFYTHFLRAIGENLSLLWMSESRLTARVDVQGVERVLKAGEGGKGILILAGHFGNWEMSSIAGMLQFKQYRNRFHVIRKSLSPGLEQLVFRRFYRAGLRVIPRYDALGRVLRALEQNDVAIFIMDQHAPLGSKGVAVEFFGKKAGTNRSLALLAGHTGAPVIPAVSYRKPDGRHVLRFEEPVEWIPDEDPGREIQLNTRRYNEVLERFVLDHPEQWFWMHRRWKLRDAL